MPAAHRGVDAQAFRDLKATREATLARLAGLDQAQMDWSPARGRWSIGEVVDHVLRVDDLVREDLGALFDRLEAGETPFLSRGFRDFDVDYPVPDLLIELAEIPLILLNFVVPGRLRRALAGSRRVPAVAPAFLEPTAGGEADALRARLREALGEIEKQLIAHPDVDLRDLRYYNPIAGFGNVPSLLRFIIGHEKRHQGQIDDLLNDDAFPRSTRWAA
ncbi:MAG: DinB family protein [Acidobacteriota bacterium]